MATILRLSCYKDQTYVRSRDSKINHKVHDLQAVSLFAIKTFLSLQNFILLHTFLQEKMHKSLLALGAILTGDAFAAPGLFSRQTGDRPSVGPLDDVTLKELFSSSNQQNLGSSDTKTDYSSTTVGALLAQDASLQ